MRDIPSDIETSAVIDALADGLNEAVADTVKQAVTTAVQEAIGAAVQAILSNPDLVRHLATQAREPTRTGPPLGSNELDWMS